MLPTATSPGIFYGSRKPLSGPPAVTSIMVPRCFRWVGGLELGRVAGHDSWKKFSPNSWAWDSDGRSPSACSTRTPGAWISSSNTPTRSRNWNAAPGCGGLARGYDRTAPLRWRHLNILQHRCELVCRLPRGRCQGCGHIWRVRPPWEGKAGGFSKEFEAFALLLMREMPMAKVARALNEMDTRPWRLLHLRVDAAHGEADFSQVCCVGVDELSVRKGHRYISVFADLVNRRVLSAAQGRDARVWPQFLAARGAHHRHRHALTQVSQDMSLAYLRGVRDHCRNAAVIHEKYHVIANLLQATAKVRRGE